MNGEEVAEDQTPATLTTALQGNECPPSQSNGFQIMVYHAICVVTQNVVVF